MKNIALIGIFLLVFPIMASSLSAQESIFSIRIIDFQSPIKLGQFLEFTYFTRSVSGVNGTAEVNLWIENQKGEVVTSGSDTIFLGGLEERTRTANIFLPTNVKSGIYQLKIEASYQGEMVSAYRTIEINVRGSLATINSGYGANLYVIAVLALLALLNIYLIYKVERAKIKEILKKEEQFFRSHKISILIVTFFLILGGLIYYLNFIGFLPRISIYYYYAVLAVLLVLVLFLSRGKEKKTR